MESVGIRALRDHLSEYLRRVRGGERVVITDRGEPVAALVALKRSPEVEAAWDLVDRGLARWSGGKPKGADQPPRLRGTPASDAVLEDRR